MVIIENEKLKNRINKLKNENNKLKNELKKWKDGNYNKMTNIHNLKETIKELKKIILKDDDSIFNLHFYYYKSYIYHKDEELNYIFENELKRIKEMEK